MAQSKKIDSIIARIFINCPFDPSYRKLLRPLLFSLLYLGFEPLITSQKVNSAELRMNKILEFVEISDHSIHDISKVKAKKDGDSYRLNMPFELGIDWGYCHFNKKQKNFLILGGEKYSINRSFSDISGCDPEYHENKPKKIIEKVRDWLVSTYPNIKFSGATKIWDEFNYFNTDLLADENYSKKDIKSMPTSEYSSNIKRWISKNN